jgi:ribosomal protein S18 acetylase RimI-like enzyme
VTAAALSQASRKDRGLRPVNSRKDMEAIADLIEAVFGHEMDPLGSRMVREMRAFGRAGFLGWLAGKLLLEPTAYLKGFVWEVDGRLVGNASLVRVEGFPKRWVLANVAVYPEYRGRGIGRSLVQASINHVQRRKGKEVILQVDATNRSAQQLYTSLEFKPLGTRTTWSRSGEIPLVRFLDTGMARLRLESEWWEQLALAKRVHPEGILWPYPLSAVFFQPSDLPSLLYHNATRHWIWREGDRLLGSLSARRSAHENDWRVILIVDETARGRIERPLISACLMAISDKRRRILLDYPTGVAEQELKELGFQPQRSLMWMKLDLGEKW